MPRHWLAFQGLWEGLSERPREVVAVARSLPRPGGRGRAAGAATGRRKSGRTTAI